MACGGNPLAYTFNFPGQACGPGASTTVLRERVQGFQQGMSLARINEESWRVQQAAALTGPPPHYILVKPEQVKARLQMRVETSNGTVVAASASRGEASASPRDLRGRAKLGDGRTLAQDPVLGRRALVRPALLTLGEVAGLQLDQPVPHGATHLYAGGHMLEVEPATARTVRVRGAALPADRLVRLAAGTPVVAMRLAKRAGPERVDVTADARAQPFGLRLRPQDVVIATAGELLVEGTVLGDGRTVQLELDPARTGVTSVDLYVAASI